MLDTRYEVNCKKGLTRPNFAYKIKTLVSHFIMYYQVVSFVRRSLTHRLHRNCKFNYVSRWHNYIYIDLTSGCQDDISEEVMFGESEWHRKNGNRDKKAVNVGCSHSLPAATKSRGHLVDQLTRDGERNCQDGGRACQSVRCAPT